MRTHAQDACIQFKAIGKGELPKKKAASCGFGVQRFKGLREYS